MNIALRTAIYSVELNDIVVIKAVSFYPALLVCIGFEWMALGDYHFLANLIIKQRCPVSSNALKKRSKFAASRGNAGECIIYNRVPNWPQKYKAWRSHSLETDRLQPLSASTILKLVYVRSIIDMVHFFMNIPNYFIYIYIYIYI